MKTSFLVRGAGICSLLALSGVIAPSILANTPDWTSVELSVADGKSSSGLSADSSISVVQTGDELACGIELQTGGTIGTISGSIYIEAESPSAVAYLAGTLDYSAIGLYNEDTGDSQGFDVDWSSVFMRTQLTGGCDTDTAYGVLLNESGSSIATGTDESIGGTIFATNTDASAAQSIAISASAGTSVGDIASTGSILAYNAGTGDSTAIDLQDDASMGDIAGSVVASADTGDATGISIDEDSTIGTISGTVNAIAETSTSNAIAIKSSSAETLVFSDSATVSAKVGSFVFSSYGTAIENTTYGISMISSSGTTSLSGNLNAGEQNIVLSSGLFTAASDTWTGTDIALGSGSLSDMSVAQLALTDSTTFDASSLSFYIDSTGNFSCISVSSGESLTLSSVNDINIYLNSSLAALDNFSLTLIDGSVTGLSDDININYIVDDIYSTANLSLSLGDDGTDYVLSGSLISVPEPCTTTLSLLALSALCARRRRQL